MTEVIVVTLIPILTFIFGIVLANKVRKGKLRIDGYLNVIKGDERLVYQLEINTPPEKLQLQDNIVLSVRKITPQPFVEDIDASG